MHLPANPVTSIFTGDVKTGMFYKFLNGCRYIANPVISPHLTDAYVECLLGDFDQPLGFRGYLTYTHGEGTISHKAFEG